jgi:hypothetical protein
MAGGPVSAIRRRKKVRDIIRKKIQYYPHMVETKSLVLEAQIVVQVPMDIIQNKQRLEDVKEGVKKAMVKGLYEEGLEFEIKKLHFKIK